MPSLRHKAQLIKEAGFEDHFQADTWEEYNQMFFDGLAPKYDFLNEILSCGLHGRIKRRAIQNIPISPHSKILDICTGSGDIAIMIAEDNPTCHVVGVDVSQNMLFLARKKAKGLSNLEFRTADALDLPFKNHEYDAAFMSFGLRNLTDIRKGILEMKRVTRPGGYITSLDLGKPKEGALHLLYKIYFELFIPLLGKFFFHRNEFNSFRYLPESNKLFPSPDELVRMFESCGLTHVSKHNFMLGGINQQIGIVS